MSRRPRRFTVVATLVAVLGVGAIAFVLNAQQSRTSGQAGLLKDVELPEGFVAREVITGRWRLSAMCFLPDGRMCIGEKETGKVFTATADGQNWKLNTTPLLTIPDCAYDKKYCERGIIGLAGWRDPATGKDYLYHNCTRKMSSGRPFANRIVRQQLDPNKPDFAWPEEVIIPSDILPAGWNHNGGALVFGPDGNLYFTDGENGVHGDPLNAQDYKTLTGTCGRVTPTGEPLADNPFYDKAAERAQNSVYAYGLRNHYRLAFDPVTRELWGTENGPESWDELNMLRAGDNGGWPHIRGMYDATHNARGRAKFTAAPGRYTEPKFAWERCASVTGIAFEPGKAHFPKKFRHGMFVAAYYGSDIWNMELDETRTKVLKQTRIARLPGADQLPGAGIADMCFGPDGRLYVCTTTYIGDNGSNDRVIVIEWAGAKDASGEGLALPDNTEPMARDASIDPLPVATHDGSIVDGPCVESVLRPCLACHSGESSASGVAFIGGKDAPKPGEKGADLLSRLLTLKSISQQTPLVTPGKPDTSWLWHKLAYLRPKFGRVMGGPLSAGELSDVRAWLSQSAPSTAAAGGGELAAHWAAPNDTDVKIWWKGGEEIVHSTGAGFEGMGMMLRGQGEAGKPCKPAMKIDLPDGAKGKALTVYFRMRRRAPQGQEQAKASVSVKGLGAKDEAKILTLEPAFDGLWRQFSFTAQGDAVTLTFDLPSPVFVVELDDIRCCAAK